VVTKSLYLRDWWVDSVKRDTNFLGAVRSIPTAAAVYNFVAGRGAPGYTSVTALPDSSGLVFHGPNGVKDTVVFEGTGSGSGSSLPSMTGNGGKVLGTDGSTAAWKQTTSYYYPEDYGAVGDGTTDDATAFAAAIAAMPQGATLFIGAKTYLINSSITINKPITIMGNGGSDYFNTSTLYKSMLKTTSGTINLFNVTSDNVAFEKVGFVNANTSPTAGSAIRFDTQGDNLKLSYCTFRNFYDNVYVNNGGQWSIDHCFFMAWRRYGLYVEYVTLPDGGDMTVSNSWFYSGDSGGTFGGTAAIYQVSGGGMKIIGNKFVGYVEGAKMPYCYKALYNANTVDLIMTGNSFEGYTVSAIDIDKEAGVSFFNNIVISGNQIAGMGTIYGDINISNVHGGTIASNHFWNPYATANPAIVLENTNNWEIGVNQYLQYSATVSVNNCTGISVQRPTVAQTTTGAFNVGIGKNAKLTLDGNKTLALNGLIEGDEGYIVATQNGTGGYGITYPSGSVIKGTMDSSAGAKNLIRYSYLGGTLYFNIAGETTATGTGGGGGTSGNAYLFSGEPQSISVANPSDFNFTYGQPFTIAMRARVTSGGILRIPISDASKFAMLCNLSGGGGPLIEASFGVGNSDNSAYVYRATNTPDHLNIDTWHKVVFVYDGTTGVKIYQNGAEVASLITSDVGTMSDIFSGGTFRIGRQHDTYHSSGATLDELIVLKGTALNATQVAEFQNSGNAISDMTTLSFWASVTDGWQFNGNLNSVRGTHNGTATTPQYQ
jgi:hypothetical protein